MILRRSDFPFVLKLVATIMYPLSNSPLRALTKSKSTPIRAPLWSTELNYNVTLNRQCQVIRSAPAALQYIQQNVSESPTLSTYKNQFNFTQISETITKQPDDILAMDVENNYLYVLLKWVLLFVLN